VIAQSFERIHRSNLIGMGVAPLQFADGEGIEELGLTGEEEFDVSDLENGEAKSVTVTARSDGDEEKTFECKVRLDTPNEVQYFRNGGILQLVLRQLRERSSS
jgi:aconitate hydratase